MAAKVREIRETEFEKMSLAKRSMQYGMANRELRPLAEAYDLEGMKAVIEYTASYSMS